MTAPIAAVGGLQANPAPFLAQQLRQTAPTPPADPAMRKAFDDFVGQTFYGQMLASMRKSQGKPAYFHGGRAEEVFQGQFDQILSEQLSEATANQFSGPMFELFNLQRR